MKRLITNYTFSAVGKTVTLNDYTSVSLASFLLITNTTSNVIIYNFADSTKGGTVGTNILTLTYDTSAMADTDKLQIFYDDDFGYADEKNFRTLRVVHVGDTGVSTNVLNTLSILQSSGAADSTNLVQVGGNAVVVGTGYQDNALRVVHATDAIVSVRVDSSSASTAAALIDSGGVQYSGSNPLPITTAANTLDIKQVSGSTDSVNLLQVGSNAVVVGSGYQDNALRVVNATDALTSVNNVAWNGNTITVGTGYQDNALRIVHATDAIVSVRVDSSSSSTAASIIDSTGVQYSGSNPVPTYIASSSTASTTVYLIDSGGVGYNGSNPIPITIVSGALTSTLVVGDSAARSADNGGNPVKVGAIARQTNPTAYSDGDRSNFSTDDLGRQLIRPVQVRDLLQTARATFTTGTEGTLLAGASGAFYDLIYITAANNSDAAVAIDIRSGTANGIQLTLQIPANGTTGLSLQPPLPQDVSANAWTVDLPDITGTTVSVSALFSKEV